MNKKFKFGGEFLGRKEAVEAIRGYGRQFTWEQWWLIVATAALVFGAGLGVSGTDRKGSLLIMAIGAAALFLLVDRWFGKGTKADRQAAIKVMAAGVIAVSAVVRWKLFPHLTFDFHIVNSWFEILKRGGEWQELNNGYVLYPPLFMTLLWGLTYLPFKVFYSLKLLPIFFDYLAGWWVYAIVSQKFGRGGRAVAAGISVVMLPSVILNSSLWAQTDAIFTAFILGSLYFLIRGSEYPKNGSYHRGALVMFGIALALKLQAVFFVLPLILFYLSRRIRWFHFLIIPGMFLVTALPALMTGWRWSELLLPFQQQLDKVFGLAVDSPTAYQLVPQVVKDYFIEAGVWWVGGIVLAIMACLARWRVEASRENYIKLAALSALLLPYILPTIHDRYFYAADILTLLLAWYYPRYWYVPLVTVTMSVISYGPYLTDTMPVNLAWLAIGYGAMIIKLAWDFGEDFRAGQRERSV